MSISRVEAERIAFARSVRVTGERLIVELTDGREISVPLSWYPRLSHGRPEEHQRWELIGRGMGIHWPDLDEDIASKACLPAENLAKAANRSSAGCNRDNHRGSDEPFRPPRTACSTRSMNPRAVTICRSRFHCVITATVFVAGITTRYCPPYPFP